MRRVGLVLAVVLLLAGCGSAGSRAAATPSADDHLYPPGAFTATPTVASEPRTNPPASPATAARTSCAPSQPARVYAPSVASNRNLEVVSIGQGASYVIRDITNIDAPVTIGSLENLDRPRFVSATELSSSDNVSEQTLLRYPFAGSPVTAVAEGCRGMIAFAWSPDGTEAAYVTDLEDRPGSELHIVENGQNRTAAAMASVPWGIDCGWPCEDYVDSRLAFSPDGSMLALVQGWGGPALRIWTREGTLLYALDGTGSAQGSPTMSAWSGSSLYFRDSRGVEKWSHGTTSLVIPGVKWIRPKASPAGGSIVYAVRDSSGLLNVYLLDTATDQVRELEKSRAEPAFLTAGYLWWRGERACTSNDPYPCNWGPWSADTGKAYLYNLDTKTESPSNVTTVYDVWPHPA